MSWTDFNDAEDQRSFDLIPKGTLAKVRMSIKPGGFDDPSQNWTGGYAKRNEATGAVFLNAEFIILEGKYARQKVWSLIGLHSNKGPEWAAMGRTFIKAILNSARRIDPDDDSPVARQARCISQLSELDGIEFVAKIEVETNTSGEQRNSIRTAISPKHQDYQRLMGLAVQPMPSPSPPSQSTPSTHRPNWAQ